MRAPRRHKRQECDNLDKLLDEILQKSSETSTKITGGLTELPPEKQVKLDEWWKRVQLLACLRVLSPDEAHVQNDCAFKGREEMEDVSKGRQGTTTKDWNLRWASPLPYEDRPDQEELATKTPYPAIKAIRAAWDRVKTHRCKPLVDIIKHLDSK